MPTSETLYETRWLSLERIGTWDFVRRPHSDACVGILPITPDDEVVLIEQFRIPPQRHVIEIPAGIVGDEEEHHGESLADTAARELLEETGYWAESWERMTTIHNAIAYSDEGIELYVAHRLEMRAPRLDAGEFLEVFTAPVGEALAMVRDGRITDVKTMIALFWLEAFLSGGNGKS